MSPRAKLPLGSASATKSISKLLTFYSRGGKQKVRLYHKPLKPASAAQLVQRQITKYAVEAWQALSDPEKAIWDSDANALGDPWSGYTLFIHHYNSFKIELHTNQTPQDDLDPKIHMIPDNICHISWGDGDFTLVSGVYKTYPHHYDSTGDYDIKIYGDLDKISILRENFKPISGNIKTFAQAAFLQSLSFHWTSMSGDIASLSGLTSLVDLSFGGCPISGDIASLSGLTSLGVIYLDWTQTSGDISSFSGLTSLEALYFDGSLVSGDIASLSGLTLLKLLAFRSTSVSGDIASLSGLTSLTRLYLSNSLVDTYTQGVLPDWDACDILIKDLGLSQQEVDDFLCDLNTSSSASTKSLDISGTNSAPSAAGEVCAQSLRDKGWTVTTS